MMKRAASQDSAEHAKLISRLSMGDGDCRKTAVFHQKDQLTLPYYIEETDALTTENSLNMKRKYWGLVYGKRPRLFWIQKGLVSDTVHRPSQAAATKGLFPAQFS